jgi:hypothetical protein
MNTPHIEKIAIDADQQRTFAGDCRTQHLQVRWISAQVRRQIGRQYNDAHASKEGSDLVSLALREIELLTELSS